MRQFLSHDGQKLLPNQFRDPERLGHVGDHVRGIEAGALGQPVHQGVDQLVDALPGHSRDGEVLGELQLSGSRQQGGQLHG